MPLMPETGRFIHPEGYKNLALKTKVTFGTSAELFWTFGFKNQDSAHKKFKSWLLATITKLTVQPTTMQTSSI